MNGGIGDTFFNHGVHDGVPDSFYQPLDLNGNGISSAATEDIDGSPTDRDIYYRHGLFFSENWKCAGTPGFQGVTRHHTTSTIIDGMSKTIPLGANVRLHCGWSNLYRNPRRRSVAYRNSG